MLEERGAYDRLLCQAQERFTLLPLNRSMSLLVASLYLLCLAFLFGSALYVLSRDPFAPLNGAFALLALSLLGWVGSLFLFNAQTANPGLLWLGRVNFVAVAIVAPAGYLFVTRLAKIPPKHQGWLWTETTVLVALTLLTGLVDRTESVSTAGEHMTAYGWLFPLYVAHILAFIVASLWIAFRSDPARSLQTRIQLRWVGTGILATTVVSLITNAIVPYFFGDFRFIHAGTLSTIFFLCAVAYAAVFHHLFNIRVVIRKALVFALLIGFALELYQIAVDSLARLLPLGDPTQRHIAAATVALIINAFTHETLRLWLERLTDRLLVGKRRHRFPRRP